MTGIITAITEEFEALADLIKDSKTETIASMPFKIGQIGNGKVVLGQCGQGKVNAACCTQLMIDRFDVDQIVNVGIAGALDPELTVSEIVLSKDALQYDMDGRGEGFPLGVIPDMGVLEFPSDPKLLELAQNLADELGVKFKTGRILTADLFLSDKKKKEEIVEEFGGTVCEMEGAAIGHVCYLNHVPYLIIRAVSDTAEENANDLIIQNLNEAMAKTVRLVEEISKALA